MRAYIHGISVRDHTLTKDGLTSRYWCSQDVNRKKDPKIKDGCIVHCDTPEMTRFSCGSYLKIKIQHIDFQQHIDLRIEHTHHAPYYGVDLPQDARKFIRENLDIAPSVLVPRIQAKFPHVTAAQVLFAWTQLSMTTWRRDDDQMKSAEELLKEFEEDGEVNVFRELEVDEGVTALAWGLPKIASRLVGEHKVVEIAMDATCEFNITLVHERNSPALYVPQTAPTTKTLSSIV